MAPRAAAVAFSVNDDEGGRAVFSGGGRSHPSLSIPLSTEIWWPQG